MPCLDFHLGFHLGSVRMVEPLKSTIEAPLMRLTGWAQAAIAVPLQGVTDSEVGLTLSSLPTLLRFPAF